LPYIAPIKSEQYPATDETQCITVYIPAGDEFKALLAGLYNIATEPQNYDDPDSAQTDGLQAVWDTAYNLIDWEGCVEVSKVQVDCFALNGAANTGSLTYNASASLPFGYAMSTDNASGRAILHGIWLESGTYSYSGWSSLTTNGGNTDVRIENLSQGLVTAIQTGIAQNGTFGNRINTIGGFSITTAGLYYITARNNGTGAGSGRQVNWISHHIVQGA